MSAIALNRSVLALISLVALLDRAGAFAADRWKPVTFKPIFAPSPLPPDGTVEFPNESPIGVTFRPKPKEEIASTPLAAYAAQLHSAQQGDAVAARTVGSWMVYCALIRGIPFSTVNTRTSGPIAQKPRGNAVHEFCGRRTEEEIASGVTWLQAAATGGDVAAMRKLPGLYLPGSSERTAALQALWQQEGSIKTLQELADAHGWRSLRYGSESADAILSLAAYWLYARLNESAFRQDSSISAFIEALGRDVRNRLGSASPQMQSDAIAASRKLLVESADCCVP